MTENQYDGNQQFGNQQQSDAPQPPSVWDYDMYDDVSRSEYQRANDRYIQHTVQRQVQAAMQPHATQLRDAELVKDYNGLVADFGSDEDFKTIMETAIRNMVDAPSGGTLREAYEKAADQQGARPGRRGYGRLPTDLRKVNSLGKIMFHNQQTGRAAQAPDKKRWF